MEEKRHVLSALVEDKPGVLAHISGLFSSRGYNIHSLTVGTAEKPGMSRMSIVVKGDDQIVEQIMKQLHKVIDVIKVQDFTGKEYVERDLVLVKLSCPPAKRPELCTVADVFRAKVVHVGEKEMIVELSGAAKKIEAFIAVITPYGIKELVRTGQVAISRT